MAFMRIDQEKCKGCVLCVRACPMKILRLSETNINTKGYRPAENVNMDKCTGCCACALTCPDVCIEVEK